MDLAVTENAIGLKVCLQRTQPLVQHFFDCRVEDQHVERGCREEQFADAASAAETRLSRQEANFRVPGPEAVAGIKQRAWPVHP
jgi:hypothetical protein